MDQHQRGWFEMVHLCRRKYYGLLLYRFIQTPTNLGLFLIFWDWYAIPIRYITRCKILLLMLSNFFVGEETCCMFLMMDRNILGLICTSKNSGTLALYNTPFLLNLSFQPIAVIKASDLIWAAETFATLIFQFSLSIYRPHLSKFK